MYVSPELISPVIVSASECICPQLPGPYAISWSSTSAKQRGSDFEEIGVRTEQRQSALEWATSALDTEFSWPGVFLTLAAARNALSRFFAAEPDMRLIGLGLPDAVAEEFITEATPPPTAGSAPESVSGYLAVANRGDVLPPGGVHLGYELLDLEYGQLAHSWLCNGLEQHCANALAVTPGPHGLIESLDDALRCGIEINRDEVGAEPGYWLPVGLVDYTGP